MALLPTLPESVYRLVHIDTDLDPPTLACLEYFGERMASGAVIVIDDYESSKPATAWDVAAGGAS